MAEQTKAVAAVERNITDTVLARVTELEKGNQLHFPANYSYQNALKSAWLILQETKDKTGNSVLQSCTKESIANTLLNMVVQGLSPAKKQCYFIAYGKQLQLSRSYFGTVAVLKRLKDVKDVFANVIYDKDEFEIELDLETGLKRVTKHNQSFENIDLAKIKGAYAVVVKTDGTKYTEVMNINQIKASWNQGQAKGNSGAHQNFADQMAMKTVITRACKLFVNTSDDSDLLIDAIHEGDKEPPTMQAQIAGEIEENANSEFIDIEGGEVIDIEPSVEQKEPEVKAEPQEQELDFVPPFA